MLSKEITIDDDKDIIQLGNTKISGSLLRFFSKSQAGAKILEIVERKDETVVVRCLMTFIDPADIKKIMR